MLMSPSLRGLSADLGVEGYVTKKARAAKKPISGLVGAREHMSVFSGLTDRQSEAVLLLTFIPNTGESYGSMVSAWKRGDAESAWRNTRAGFADYPAFGERILEARRIVYGSRKFRAICTAARPAWSSSVSHTWVDLRGYCRSSKRVVTRSNSSDRGRSYYFNSVAA